MKHMARWVLLLLALTMGALGLRAEPWPSKPIRLIVPFPAGGPTDLIAREAANILRNELKQPVVVENRPGGNGVLGHAVLAKAPADGYTLGLLVITVAIAPHLGSTGFDPFKDFAPITNMMTTTPILVANKNAPFNDLNELVAYAKDHPGQVAYGTPGVGTIPHLAVELLELQTGVKLNHIPYKGATQQIQDLIGGSTQLDSQSSLVVALPQLQADRIKALAVLSSQRAVLLPNVPTAKESGYPGLVIAPWFGLGAPAGVAPEIVQKLHAILRKGLRTKEVQDKFASLGIGVQTSASPADFAEYIRSEYQRWGQLIKTANIQAE